jgi:N-acetyl-anhydromuramyl-L-alanine amidase AmpD
MFDYFKFWVNDELRKRESDVSLTREINLEYLDTDEIIQVPLPQDQYIPTETPKKQIVLHHTVSPVGVSGDLSWWRKTTARVATSIIIHHNGDIYQCFSSRYWAHHLGIKQKFLKSLGFSDYRSRNVLLNKQAIGIEIDSAGGLVEKGGKWHTAFNTIMPEDRIEFYPNGFRGYEAFEKYTDEQLESTRQLLVYWHDHYDIPLDYNEDMWEVNLDAIGGKPGVWAHVSYRNDKSDTHPQPELIKMLKTLK